MIPGLYASASGMLTIEKRQEVISNNIANAATSGFKRQSPVQLGFYQVFSGQMRAPFHFNIEAAPAGGAKMVETYPHLQAGALAASDDPLHAALDGPGYFAVETPQGERYTRDGSFTIDVDGHLATAEGYKIASVDGPPLDVRGGNVALATDGTVTVDGVPAGRLRMVEFETPERLLREGSNLYRASEEVAKASSEAVDTRIEHGHLEASNVNLPTEMVNMILGLRLYEANQKAIQSADTTIGLLIEQVGSP